MKAGWLLLLLPVAPAWAIEDCVAGERRVSLSNGASTAGYTGIVRCFDRDTREEVHTLSFINGKQSGWEKRKWPNGTALDQEYRDGKRHGEQRRYEGGALVEVSHYVDDRELGEGLRYSKKSGKLVRRTHRREPAAASTWEDFDEEGRLLGAGCGLQSVWEAGLKDCRWPGPSPLTFFHPGGVKRAVIELKDGLRHGLTTTFDRQGNKRFETSFAQGKRDGMDREFEAGQLARATRHVAGLREGDDTELFPDGGVQRVSTWKGSELTRQVEFFQNGSRKTVQEWTQERLVESRFDDRGRLVERVRKLGRTREGLQEAFFPDGGAALRESFSEGRLQGRRQRFYEHGQPAEDSQWNDGHLTARKRWDPDGGLVEDEAFYEDGSRKPR